MESGTRNGNGRVETPIDVYVNWGTPMLYVFDDYELDTQTCELRRDGVPVALAPKTYAVLAFLVEHRDRLISKEELLDELWPDTYVDDSAVKRNIMAIRRALRDRSSPAQCIKTQRSQGYRFIASVTVYDQAPQTPAAILPHPREDDVEEPQDAAQCCAACQSPNPATARFCAHCGTPLGTQCPQCAQTMLLSASFCPACGHRLMPAAEAAPPSPPNFTVEHGPIGERKLVTVLYCVLADASGLVARRGLDAMHTAMHAVYDGAVVEAQRYAGTVQAVTGESVLILFGVPVAQEDHAQRAVLTAMGLQQRLLQENVGGVGLSAEEIGFRLALHTGPVVVGPLGHDQPATAAVVGDVTTRAATIAHHALPGTIVASEATIRLVPGTIEAQALPALHVHDDLAPLPVYHVLRAVPRRPEQGPIAPQTRSPLVGREAEIALLRARFDRVAQGQGQVVTLSGEPGIGKSRLLSEWRRDIASNDVRVLYGQCQSYSRALPYGPLRDLLHGAWGLSELDGMEARCAKVRDGLHAAGCEVESSTPYMLDLLGVEDESDALTPMAPDMLRAQTFDVLQHFFLRSSHERPCLLILEDLHWIDATSEAFLTVFVERLAGVPILLLTTFRLGYRPSWLDKSYATHIALQPLDQSQSRQMVQRLLPQMLQEGLVEQHILAKAQGNPLFVEELAQAAAEYDNASSAFAVPDTIQAVLAARIDGLAVEEKRLLHTAAVVGPEVPFDLLHAVTDYASETLRRLLANLQGAELLYETRLFPESVYTFKHALTHEVAYETLLHSHRQTLHRRVFDALEYSSSDAAAQQPDRLAYHAREAALWDQAWPYFRHAGVEALTQAANSEAVTHFEQALQCLEHLPQDDTMLQEVAIDIRLDMRNALLPLGDNARCLALMREAKPLAEEPGRCRATGVDFVLYEYAQFSHRGFRPGDYRWRTRLGVGHGL